MRPGSATSRSCGSSGTGSLHDAEHGVNEGVDRLQPHATRRVRRYLLGTRDVQETSELVVKRPGWWVGAILAVTWWGIVTCSIYLAVV